MPPLTKKMSDTPLPESINLQRYKLKDQREHVYIRPDTYIGSTVMEVKECFLIDVKEEDLKCVKKKILYNPGLERIFLEIISNAGDNVGRSRLAGIDPGKIKVEIKEGIVTVYNEGQNMPTDIHPEYGVHLPQFLLGTMLTGSNFDDEDERKLGGRNGIGAKATNIFSKIFIVEIGDSVRKVKYQQVFQENLTIIKEPKITPDYTGIGYTKISYVADFDRFYADSELAGQHTYTLDLIQSFCKHVIDIAFTSGIEITVNGRVVKLDKLDDYGKLYVNNPLTKRITYSDENNDLIIFDTPDKGNTISFVNGIITEKGGVHVNDWLDVFCDPIVEKFKKHEITRKDIKPHITLILSCKLNQPKFKTQSKEYVVGPKPQVAKLDLKQVGSWGLIDKIRQIIALKEGKLASKTDGKKTRHVNVKNLKDAGFAGGRRSLECILYISEGNSASSCVVKGVGDNRNICGSYPVRGKPLNTSKSEMEQYQNNKEINDIKLLLGLREGVNYLDEKEFATLRYGQVRIFADQDLDGSHIIGLIFNFFRSKFKSLLLRGYVDVMESPLLTAKKGTVKRKFYTQEEYDTWKASSESQGKWEIKYYKGLGTIPDPEIIEEFKNPRIVKYSYDEKADLYMALAFDKDNESHRKKWIRNHIEKPIHKTKPDTLSYFFDEKFVLFSIADVYRSIPSIWDGLKPSQRKVLFGCSKKSGETKVSQLAGFISDETRYHHGEDALCQTIINMAQSHIGTNNVPLLEHIGQFGTREGKDAAAPRYICVKISPLFSSLFKKDDEILLEHLIDEDKSVEPRYYYPIIPIWAVNGSCGIGTGFSTSIPCYHPLSIIQWLQVRILTWMGKEIAFPTLFPWYRGYQGVIRKIGDKWHSQGTFQEQREYLLVTELPVTVTIKGYLEKIAKKIENETATAVKDVSFAAPIKGRPKDYDKVPRIQVYGITNPTIRSMGLDSVIGESNITVMDGDYKCRTFKGIEEVMEEFARLRLGKYKERKEKRIPMQKVRLEMEEKRLEFVRKVIGKQIKLDDEEDVLKEVMEKNGYPDEFLRMSIRSCTKKKIAELQTHIDAIKKDIEYYTNTSAEQLWLTELKELAEKLAPILK